MVFLSVIPERIRTLLAAWGKNPIEIVDVTFRASVADKRAYRLVFEDGSKAKARLLMGRDHAARWCDLRKSIGDRPFFSSLLLHEGETVLEEWVEGEVLSSKAPLTDRLFEAGAVLACIHAEPMPESGMTDASAQADELCALLSVLVRAKAIDADAERRLAMRLRMEAPGSMRVGLAHHDFCGENLVLHDSRGVVSIDHEWMRIGSLDFDLARALRQWKLDGMQREAFVEGYISNGGAVDLRAFNFWLLANDIFASEVRVRRSWPDASATVARLLEWIER
jgi:hypothetical protein